MGQTIGDLDVVLRMEDEEVLGMEEGEGRERENCLTSYKRRRMEGQD